MSIWCDSTPNRHPQNYTSFTLLVWLKNDALSKASELIQNGGDPIARPFSYVVLNITGFLLHTEEEGIIGGLVPPASTASCKVHSSPFLF